MTISRIATLVAIPLLVAGLTACTSSAPEPITPAAPTNAETSAPEIAEPTVEPEPDSDCITVAQSTIDALNNSIAAVQAGNQITAAYAMRAGERENVYFIAADITGEGMRPGDAPGLWATNDDVTIDPHSGMMFSVNSYATIFSDMADGTDSSVAFSSREDGAREALDCIPQ